MSYGAKELFLFLAPMHAPWWRAAYVAAIVALLGRNATQPATKGARHARRRRPCGILIARRLV